MTSLCFNESLSFYSTPIPVMLASSPVDFDEEDMQDVMRADTIKIIVDLHAGDSVGKAWGCDLSYDYVKINALYRT